MIWHDLLFAHWPVPSHILRPHVPPRLIIDEFDGTAWLAVVPFVMTGIRLRGLPPFPGLTSTLELNVRTYVRLGDRAGVWFFSLDAAKWPIVKVARATFHLNYQHARMSLARDGERVRYQSRRIHPGSPPAEFACSYTAVGAPYASQPGSLEHWLTERYSLFSADDRGRLYRGDIHHAPWPLQPAAAEFERNSMTGQLGFELPKIRPLLHFAKVLRVRAWPAVRS